MKITIVDIAEKAGVSVATVSRIINNVPNAASEQTRDRVLRIIKEYNYRPSMIAKSMITNRTRSIGLLVPDILNQSFQHMCRGVEDEAMLAGYNVFLCNTDKDTKKYLRYVESLLQKNVEGFILTGAPNQEAARMIELLDGQKVVVIDRNIEGADWPKVSQSHVTAAYNVVRHLIEQGHREIATITGPSDYVLSQMRLRGYKKALAEAGIPFNKKLVFEGEEFSIECGEALSRRMLEETKPTAVFCQNDMIAYGVYKTCRAMNVRIPEDLSVAGYDDLLASEVVYPELTTVRLPFYEMGRAATGMLLSWIENDEKPKRNMRFDTKLFVRNSVKKMDPMY